MGMKKILVVEDDFSIRELMHDVLTGEGYEVAVAENGQDALDVLKRQAAPALIVLDMTMPVMNGREFLDVKLVDAKISKIPVLVVSAIADEKNTVGATAFIRKPVDLNVLLALVERYAST
jgi:CheY-like chemotaxis protein